MNPTVTVVDIRSLSYTGTTWINLILGCHPRAFALGPPDRVIRLIEEHGDPADACRVHLGNCKFWPRFIEQYDHHDNFFAQLARFSGRDIIVINNPMHRGPAARHLESEHVTTRPVQVVRDGRAVCNSYLRHHPNESFEAAARDWFGPAARSFAFEPDNPEVIAVQYERVAANPGAFGRRASAFLGIEYPPNFHRFWEFEHHTTVGNAGPISTIRRFDGVPFTGEDAAFREARYQQLLIEPDRPTVDERWREDLSEEDRLVFDLHCGSINGRWGYDRDRFTAEQRRRHAGLSRRSPRLEALRARLVRAVIGLGARKVRDVARSLRNPRRSDEERRAVAQLNLLFDAIGAEWEAEGVDQAAYLSGFKTPAKIANRRRMFEACLATVPSFEGSVGCDIGCWLGFTTAILSSLGPRLVHGIEIQPRFTELNEQWRRRHAVEGVRFNTIEQGRIPLEDGEADWAVIMHVLCNAMPDSFDQTLDEASRILRPGGLFVLSDGNNPHCPATVERLQRTYRTRELGEEGPGAQPGINYTMRLRRIAELAPELDEKTAIALAAGTCYMWGEQVDGAVRRYREDGAMPDSRFDPDALRPTRNPVHGGANGNITDPYDLAQRLERRGFEKVTINTTAEAERLDVTELSRRLAVSQNFFLFARKAGG